MWSRSKLEAFGNEDRRWRHREPARYFTRIQVVYGSIPRTSSTNEQLAFREEGQGGLTADSVIDALLSWATNATIPTSTFLNASGAGALFIVRSLEAPFGERIWVTRPC